MEFAFSPYIRRALYGTLPPGHQVGPRIIYDYEFLYVKDGQYIIEIDGKRYESHPGDLFIIRPNQWHTIYVSQDRELVQPHIHCDLQHYDDAAQVPIPMRPMGELTDEQRRMVRRDVLAENFPDIPQFISVDHPKEIERMIVDVILAHDKEPSYLNSVRESMLFSKLLYYVLYQIEFYGKPRQTTQMETAQKIKSYLDHNIHRELSLDAVAAQCFLSKSYLITVFRKTYGKTPHQYHQEQRVNEACYLLSFTTYAITDIAAILGFSSIHAFSKIFKKHQSMSPRCYREMLKMPTMGNEEERSVEHDEQTELGHGQSTGKQGLV